MLNWTQLIDFCSLSLNFFILGIFSMGFLGNICVRLSWPSILKLILTLLMKMLQYIYGHIDGGAYSI